MDAVIVRLNAAVSLQPRPGALGRTHTAEMIILLRGANAALENVVCRRGGGQESHENDAGPVRRVGRHGKVAANTRSEVRRPQTDHYCTLGHFHFAHPAHLALVVGQWRR